MRACRHVGAGVVDADYRGEALVLLINNGPDDLQVNTGDKIAQIVLEKASNAEAVVGLGAASAIQPCAQ